jgi:mono/diheme cytochrome c family protein
MGSWRYLAALVLAAGCQGVIGDAPDPTEPTPGTECTTLASPGAPVPMRRLTAIQVQRSVSDILGIEAPLNVADETLFTFKSNISSAVDLVAARGYFDFAEAIVAASDKSACAAADEACSAWLYDDVGARLFRRPLSDEERTRYATLFDAGAAEDGATEGARWVLESMLQSPTFLYLDEVTHEDGYLDDLAMASRLALTIWGANPDAELLAKAAAGELATGEQIEAEANRMLDDPRSLGGLTDFVDQWLRLDKLDDPDARPDLEALGQETLLAMRSEPVQLFQMLIDDGANLESLLTTSQSVSLAPLTSLYAGDLLSDDGQRVELDPAIRAGILALPGVMAALSHAEATSPSVRGFSVLKNFLCDPPPPPPAGVAVTLPEIGEDATTRERLEAHFSDPSCASCHAAMDGIGFTFEKIDWLGRSRTEEFGKPIDDSATFELDGESVDVAGVAQMAAALGDSNDIATCVARQWVSYGAGMPDQDASACIVDDLADKAQGDNGLRNMIISFVTSDWYRKGPIAEGSQP